MKKVVAIIWFIVILFNVFGFELIFKIMQNNIQNHIKQEIKQCLKDDELTVIIISLNDESKLYWVKPDKEMIYKGKMYDVVRTKIHNEKKYYYCINDEKEKQLIDNYNKTHNSQKELEKRIKKVEKINLYCQKTQFINYQNNYEIIFLNKSFYLVTNYLEPQSPPPKLI